MKAVQYLAVKNFETFQHYKDRAPAWIKLYNALLDDYAFLSLSDSARGHLMLIWLIASRHDNRIPYDAGYIQRAIHAKSRVDLATLIASGFLIVLEQSASDVLAQSEHLASGGLAKPENGASNVLAEPAHDASPHARPRTRGEKRREEKNTHMGAGAPASEQERSANPHFAAAWDRYPLRDGSNPRRDAERAFHARLTEGEDAAAMIAGTERYAAWCEHREQLGTAYVMQAKRFYGPEREYSKPWSIPRDPLELAADAQRADIERSAEWLAARMAHRNGALP